MTPLTQRANRRPIRHSVEQETFYALAVGAGFLLIGLVVYSYLRPKPEHRSSVTALLGLLGFALVASPNWTRISIRSEGLELSLLREIEGRQLRALSELQERLRAPDLPPSQRAVPAPASVPDPAPGSDPPPDGAAPHHPTEPAEPSDPHEQPGDLPAQRGGTDRRYVAQREADVAPLLDAWRRGELDLSTLSDAELLALNEQVGAPRQRATARPR